MNFKFGKLLHKAFSLTLDAIYPRSCPICGGKSDRDMRYICWNCFSQLPFNSPDKPHCVRCGKIPDTEFDGDFLCEACRSSTPSYDLARTALPFHTAARDLIHTLKYKKGLWVRNDLVDMLEGCARAHYDTDAIDLVVPVPLNQAKRRERGYNQAAELARDLAKRLKVPYSEYIMERTRYTSTQTHLTVTGRKSNVHHAFEVTDPSFVRARTVLIVDDVMTTGATLSECARILKSSGAWRVWALTIARG